MTVRRIGLMMIVGAMVSVASGASAQTHPCSEPFPATATTTNASIMLGICEAQIDKDGDATTIIGFKVRIDGTVVFNWTSPSGLTPTTPTPNAEGLYYYETPPIAISKGTHTVDVSASDVNAESEFSVALSVTRKGRGPQKPARVRAK